MSLNQVASFFNLIDVIDFASVYFIPKIKGYFCKLDYVKNVLLQKIRYKKSSLDFRSCLCSTQGRDRTGTSVTSSVFETDASTNSAT